MKIKIIKAWEHQGKSWPVGTEVAVQRSYGLKLIEDGYAVSLEGGYNTTSYGTKNTTEIRNKETRTGRGKGTKK